MKSQIKSALKEAIIKSLKTLHDLSPGHQEPYLCWTKQQNGGWRGEYQPRTSLYHLFSAVKDSLNEDSSDFARLFFSEYSDYGGGKLVGVAGLGSQQLDHDHSHILKKALVYLWEKDETFSCPESDVDLVIEEFEEFLDSSTMEIRFQAQLINFQMAAPALDLTDALAIRRLSEREVSVLHGGSAMGHHRSPWYHSINEFVIECDYVGVKVVAGTMANMIPAQEIANAKLSKVIQCLRTFKEGFVGYDWVHFRFVKFCPLDLGSSGSLDLHVRPGVYRLSEPEVTALPEFAQAMFALAEPALETACARLTDAEARLRPQDQILDAVIGMEALLLAGLGKDDRRSELKYRFSMNYSTLFESREERWHAYKTAKDLYDHRSTIAHGGDIAAKDLRVGEEKLPIHEVAMRAKSALRKIIKHFLPYSERAPYKKSQFWEQAYFGSFDSKTN